MEDKAVVVIGVLIIGGVLLYAYSKNGPARIPSASQQLANELAQEKTALLASGTSAAGSIISGLGSQISNLFGNQNSSGITMPTETNLGFGGTTMGSSS